MFGLSAITEFMVAAAALAGTLVALFRTVQPIGRKLDQVISTLDDVHDLLRHEWDTNGQTGIRDTITYMLSELRGVRTELARGSERFRQIEASQGEGAQRGEEIESRLDELSRQVTALTSGEGGNGTR